MQRTLPLLLVAILALGVAGILTRSRPSPEHQAARAAYQMLDLAVALPGPGANAPTDAPRAGAAGGATHDSGPAFWQVFLEASVEPASEPPSDPPSEPIGRPVLRLGAVRADPQPARLSADCAGELLALPTRTSFGVEAPGAPPLWRALLEGPAAQRDPETGGVRVRLHGCRHSADPAFQPMIEESYFARLSIATALQELAADHPEFQPLVVEGIEVPGPGDRPGLNFEVQLMGPLQVLTVTLHRAEGPPLYAQRPWSADPPNDAIARRSLVEGLRQRAGTDPRYAELQIEGVLEPVPGGIDLRLEYFGERQALAASLRDGRTLKVARPWLP